MQNIIPVSYTHLDVYKRQPLGIETGEKKNVTVWRDTVEAIHYSNEIDKWFSNLINYDCRLVYMPDTTQRKTNKDFNVADDIVSFADGYPVLILGQSALDKFNEISGKDYKMNRCLLYTSRCV